MNTNKAVLLMLDAIDIMMEHYYPRFNTPAPSDYASVKKSFDSIRKAIQAEEEGITGFPWIDLTNLAFKVLRENGVTDFKTAGWWRDDTDAIDGIVLEIKINRTPQEVAELNGKYSDAIASSEHYSAEATMRFRILFEPAGE